MYEGRQFATIIQTCQPHGYWPCLLAVRESEEGEGRRKRWRGKWGWRLDESVQGGGAKGDCTGKEDGGRGKKEDGRESRATVGEKKKLNREKEREFLTEGGLRESYIAARVDNHLNNQTDS